MMIFKYLEIDFCPISSPVRQRQIFISYFYCCCCKQPKIWFDCVKWNSQARNRRDWRWKLCRHCIYSADTHTPCASCARTALLHTHHCWLWLGQIEQREWHRPHVISSLIVIEISMQYTFWLFSLHLKARCLNVSEGSSSLCFQNNNVDLINCTKLQ